MSWHEKTQKLCLIDRQQIFALNEQRRDDTKNVEEVSLLNSIHGTSHHPSYEICNAIVPPA